eukprot:7887613-Pyramimonas_sp.AAC.1
MMVGPAYKPLADVLPRTLMQVLSNASASATICGHSLPLAAALRPNTCRGRSTVRTRVQRYRRKEISAT